jgi:ParB-like chromosome segregation protein Spo0J
LDHQLIPIDAIVVGERRRPLGDVSALARSINEVGLLHPIVVTPDRRLIAGWHRLEACRLLGWTEIPAVMLDVDALVTELAEIDENLIRNDLTVLERAEHLARRKEIHEQLHPETKRGTAGAIATNEKRWGAVATVPETVATSFVEDTARKTGLAPRTIWRDVQIATQVAPDVRDAIRHTPLAEAKRELLELARLDPDEQRQVVQVLQEGEARDVREAKRTILRQRILERAPSPEALERSNEAQRAGDFAIDSVYVADIATLSLRAASVDMIFTDPPYHDEHLDLYRHLARFARECLKPGAYLMVYAGKAYLPELMTILGEHLEYVWLFGVFQPDNNQRFYKHRIFEAWRPILCYRQPGETRVREWQPDMIRGTRDKTFHEWQQQIEPALKWIGAYTSEGDLIVDPFVGGGTTIAAAQQLGRHFLGFDRDPDAVRLTLGRIADEAGVSASR